MEVHLQHHRAHFLQKIDRFSVAVLQLLVITLVGLPILCVLTLPYILPGAESFAVINFFHFSVMLLLLRHFSTQVLTLFS